MATHPREVLLVDDELGVRRAVELLLRDGGFRVAGVAGTAEEARGLLRRRRYDVALMEPLLEGEATAPLAAQLLRERPHAPLVVYAGRDATPDALAAAVALQVPGLVLKASPPPVLWEALHAVADGGTFLDPELARRLPVAPRRPVRAGVALLSPREREILDLLADGWSGAEIAERLYLSAETVRTHVRNSVQKLGARTRTHAVALLVASRAGSPLSLQMD